MSAHTPGPLTPADFMRRFPRYVYRPHKGGEQVQWRQAALEMCERADELAAALRGVLAGFSGSDVLALATAIGPADKKFRAKCEGADKARDAARAALAKVTP